MGDWIPGAREAVRKLLDANHTVYIYSARLSPIRMDGTQRTPAEVMQAIQAVRDMLDDAGLHGVDIWQGSGKPFWHLLIDDRAMRFPGRPGSWKKILPAALARAGDRATADSLLHGDDAQ